jgi:hypothetical protein
MAVVSGATETRGRRPGMTMVKAVPSMVPSASTTRQAATRRRPPGVCSTPFDAPGYRWIEVQAVAPLDDVHPHAEATREE